MPDQDLTAALKESTVLAQRAKRGDALRAGVEKLKAEVRHYVEILESSEPGDSWREDIPAAPWHWFRRQLDQLEPGGEDDG